MRNIFLCICLCFFIGCVSKTTCWKIINNGKCVPIKSYEKWNKCVTNCEHLEIKSKTKSYKPKEWIRPRPYAYP